MNTRIPAIVAICCLAVVTFAFGKKKKGKNDDNPPASEEVTPPKPDSGADAKEQKAAGEKQKPDERVGEFYAGTDTRMRYKVMKRIDLRNFLVRRMGDSSPQSASGPILWLTMHHDHNVNNKHFFSKIAAAPTGRTREYVSPDGVKQTVSELEQIDLRTSESREGTAQNAQAEQERAKQAATAGEKANSKSKAKEDAKFREEMFVVNRVINEHEFIAHFFYDPSDRRWLITKNPHNVADGENLTIRFAPTGNTRTLGSSTYRVVAEEGADVAAAGKTKK